MPVIIVMYIELDARLAVQMLQLEQLHRLRKFNLSDIYFTECPEMQSGASHVLQAIQHWPTTLIGPI